MQTIVTCTSPRKCIILMSHGSSAVISLILLNCYQNILESIFTSELEESLQQWNLEVSKLVTVTTDNALYMFLEWQQLGRFAHTLQLGVKKKNNGCATHI